MIVAIHQPNYLPWLGYFSKIARADVFVFLDDVQFSKGSYTNRVKVASADQEDWLTVPVSVRLGMPIKEVRRARDGIGAAHADRLRQLYCETGHFRTVFPWLRTELVDADGGLADANARLVMAISHRLGLAARFVIASDLGIDADDPSERLARIVEAIAPGGIYLAGAGAAGYQDDSAFERRGLSVWRPGYSAPAYSRGSGRSLPGLSVVDALFYLGLEATAQLLTPAEHSRR